MDEVISNVLLTIGAIIAVSILIAAVYPSVQRMGDTSSAMTKSMSEKMATKINIIHESKVNTTTVDIWLKNIGKQTVGSDALESSDLFFGPKGNFTRATYNGASTPSWTYTLENDSGEGNWDPQETLKVRLVYTETLTSQNYYVKMVLFNGVFAEDYFSV